MISNYKNKSMADRETIYFRVPGKMKRDVEKEAQQSGRTLQAYMMDIVERREKPKKRR